MTSGKVPFVDRGGSNKWQITTARREVEAITKNMGSLPFTSVQHLEAFCAHSKANPSDGGDLLRCGQEISRNLTRHAGNGTMCHRSRKRRSVAGWLTAAMR
jgi:hypothetical protein